MLSVPGTVEVGPYFAMLIEEELAQVKPQRDTILTIGVFDGVHRGHQHLFAELRRQAEEQGLLSGVLTFFPHPQHVLSSDPPVTYLCTVEERVQVIRALGIDFVQVVTFNHELSQVRAADFVHLLQEYLRMRGLVVGPDFALGKGREGNLSFLERMGRVEGFSVSVVLPYKDEAGVVSSTAIRRALAAGDVGKVAFLLGRNFSLIGLVVRGDERGHLLGFPTANLELSPGLALPGDGTYACRAFPNQVAHEAVCNIGVRPTFGGERRVVEAHILGFNGDLYGQHLRIELVERLRAERRFGNVEELKAQIGRDIEQATRILRGEQ